MSLNWRSSYRAYGPESSTLATGMLKSLASGKSSLVSSSTRIQSRYAEFMGKKRIDDRDFYETKRTTGSREGKRKNPANMTYAGSATRRLWKP